MKLHWEACIFDIMEFSLFFRQPHNFRGWFNAVRPPFRPPFYIIVKFPIWTTFFPITILARNPLLWLYKVILEKHIRSASMKTPPSLRKIFQISDSGLIKPPPFDWKKILTKIFIFTVDIIYFTYTFAFYYLYQIFCLINRN